MNERIRELAEQAGAVYSNDHAASLLDDEIEKFAELIIQQCGVALSPMLRDMVSRGQAFDLIKDHFGVEEQVQDSKELHTCPYREEIHNDYESLCDCDEEQQHQCAMDI
jgi:hypothetical protein